MKKVIAIYDEVEVISSRRKSTIIQIIETKTTSLHNGKVVTSTTTRYGLENHATTYLDCQLKYIGMKPVKEKVIDDLIVDSLLAHGKFDYLRQFLNQTEDTRPDRYCNCGGAMYETYWKETSGLRCMDCGKIEYENGR